jgi:hypothetical protein
MLGTISFVGSGMFILGSACKSPRAMRLAMLIGASIFAFVFAKSGLNNGVNLSNFILNIINVFLHSWRLSEDWREYIQDRRQAKKIMKKVEEISKRLSVEA